MADEKHQQTGIDPSLGQPRRDGLSDLRKASAATNNFERLVKLAKHAKALPRVDVPTCRAQLNETFQSRIFAVRLRRRDQRAGRSTSMARRKHGGCIRLLNYSPALAPLLPICKKRCLPWQIKEVPLGPSPPLHLARCQLNKACTTP